MAEQIRPRKAVQFVGNESEAESNQQDDVDKDYDEPVQIIDDNIAPSEMVSKRNSEKTGRDEESLNFGSQKRSERSTTMLKVDESRSTRTQKAYEKEIFEKSKQLNTNMHREAVDEINLTFNSKQQTLMDEGINNLFDLLKEEETGKVDITHLKAYMSHQNVQNHNPTLFKRINDMAARSGFGGTLDNKAFQALFLNTDLLIKDIELPDNQPPTLQQIAELFEFLDEDRTGMISSKDLLAMLEVSERLKNA